MALEEKKRLLASLQEQKQHLEAEIKKEQLPSIPRVAVSTLTTISPAEQLMTETDKALKTLQAELTTVEKKQQIPHSDPSQRLTPTAKEYFGYTRDQDLVIFKEDGELLYKRAEELKQKVCNIGGQQAKDAIDAYELYIKNQLTSPINNAAQA